MKTKSLMVALAGAFALLIACAPLQAGEWGQKGMDPQMCGMFQCAQQGKEQLTAKYGAELEKMKTEKPELYGKLMAVAEGKAACPGMGGGKHGGKFWGWKKWHNGVKPGMVLRWLVGLAFLIAVCSALLVLLQVAAAGYVARLGKSIANHLWRNLVVGLVIVAAWLALAKVFDGNNIAGLVLVIIAAVLAVGMTFAGAAVSQMVGEKVLAASGKKGAGAVKSIVAGLAVITLAACVLGPGTLALAVILLVELGAAVCVACKLG